MDNESKFRLWVRSILNSSKLNEAGRQSDFDPEVISQGYVSDAGVPLGIDKEMRHGDVAGPSLDPGRDFGSGHKLERDLAVANTGMYDPYPNELPQSIGTSPQHQLEKIKAIRAMHRNRRLPPFTGHRTKKAKVNTLGSIEDDVTLSKLASDIDEPNVKISDAGYRVPSDPDYESFEGVEFTEDDFSPPRLPGVRHNIDYFGNPNMDYISFRKKTLPASATESEKNRVEQAYKEVLLKAWNDRLTRKKATIAMIKDESAGAVAKSRISMFYPNLVFQMNVKALVDYKDQLRPYMKLVHNIALDRVRFISQEYGFARNAEGKPIDNEVRGAQRRGAEYIDDPDAGPNEPHAFSVVPTPIINKQTLESEGFRSEKGLWSLVSSPEFNEFADNWVFGGLPHAYRRVTTIIKPKSKISKHSTLKGTASDIEAAEGEPVKGHKIVRLPFRSSSGELSKQWSEFNPPNFNVDIHKLDAAINIIRQAKTFDIDDREKLVSSEALKKVINLEDADMTFGEALSHATEDESNAYVDASIVDYVIMKSHPFRYFIGDNLYWDWITSYLKNK